MTLPDTSYRVLYLAALVIHIVSGFIGMYGGLVPLFTRKGGKAHRKWGVIFTWAMGIAALTSFPLAYWRADTFQFLIGIFSGYLTVFGYRVLHRHKVPDAPLMLDWGIGIVCGTVFLIATGWGIYSLQVHPEAEARVAVAFGVLGLLIATRDLHSLATNNTSYSRRIIDHMIASSLAVVSAFSSFLNTQFYRLTHLNWEQDAKMLLPVVVSLPLLAYWLPVWAKRLRTKQNTADLLRYSGSETSERELMRGFGMAEGVSFLLLLCVAVPLKRFAGHPEFVRIMGPLHGALFVLYVVSVVLTGRALRWSARTFVLAIAAGVLPFGTFVLEKYWERHLHGK